MVWVVAPLLFRWKLPCPVRLERLPASMAETAYASILAQMDLEICTFSETFPRGPQNIFAGDNVSG